MQKNKLIESIQYRLKPVDETEQFPYQVVEAYADQVYRAFVEMAHKKNDIYELDYLAKRYDSVPVVQDGVTDQYYSTLPEVIIDSKYGVRRITQAKDTSSSFVPATDQEIRYMYGSNADLLDTTILYTSRQNRVDYYGIGTSITSVSMHLIIPLEKYGDEDEVNIPGGGFGEFVTAVVNYAMGTPLPDLLNNESDQ